MKNLLFLLIPFLYSSQNIKIKIPDDKEIEFSSTRYEQICFNIENKTRSDYRVIFDKKGFSTAENDAIDDMYLGVANIRIFEGEKLIKPIIGSYGYQTEDIKRDTIEEKELALFKKKNSAIFQNQIDLYNAYKINSRIIDLKSMESKSMCFNISLPIYKSPADDGSILYNLENGKKYYLQVVLDIPQSLMTKYMLKSKLKGKVFTGKLISNKIPFIYRE